MMPIIRLLWIVSALLMSSLAFGHGKPAPGLNTVRIPKVKGLNAIVVNPKYARILGKALFWDTTVSSDGSACATCHYHAGADERSLNQINTGDLDLNQALGLTFQPTRSGGNPNSQINTNYQLKQSDFPMWSFANPADKHSKLLFSTDDVVGSQGTFMADFIRSNPASNDDDCKATPDALYHDPATLRNTRQVTDRNAPTVINAGFNFRNFWDGRANNIFNGQSSWGNRDPDAAVYVDQRGALRKVRLALENSSLASQAVAPPVNTVEMSCANRQFPDIAHKLLDRLALSTQDVAVDDSLLASVRNASGQGLNLTYRELITKAFSKKYWGASGKESFNGVDYAQIELNFAMFFGLSVQMYEDTLISDQTPYDTPMTPYTEEYVVGGKVPSGLSPSQKRGLVVFLNNHCALCHAGPTFSSAAHPSVFKVDSPNGAVLVERTAYGVSPQTSPIPYALRDTGFANTNVVPQSYDPGQNADDPWKNPLSFVKQYLNALQKGSVELVDPVQVYACDMEYPFFVDWKPDTLEQDPNGYKPGKCRGQRMAAEVPTPEALKVQLALPNQGKAFATVNTFKIPGLRNVELTGPFMHNGSMKSLKEVVDFYNRGGNVDNQNALPQLIFPMEMSEQDLSDLIDFLHALTDERVRWEQGPFDHPSIRIPDGYTQQAFPGNPNFAADQYELVPAVGKSGRSKASGPLPRFEDTLPE